MTNSEKGSKENVWDLPLRLFHWSLVIAFAISVYTGLNGGFDEMDYHMWSGYVILTLILFRVCWGFISNGNARFSEFIKPPSAVLHYLKFGGHSKGHNPLGALSVVAMLILLLIQAFTGLFSNDDIMVEGPLMHLVSDELSGRLTSWHHYNIWLVGGIVGLHLCAIGFYEYKKERLTIKMITGSQPSTQSNPELRQNSPDGSFFNKEPNIEFKREPDEKSDRKPKGQLFIGLVTLVICALFVYYLVNHL